MNTKTIGERSEAMVLARFLQMGVPVLTPFGDNQRYDLVIDTNEGFKRVQVKTGKVVRGAVAFSTASTYAHRGGKRKGYVGEVDYFAVFAPEIQRFFLVPIADAPSSGMRIRVQCAKRHNSKVREATDYDFDCWVAQLVERRTVNS